MNRIIFKQENGEEVVTYANDGESLLEVARNAGVEIDAPCAGNGVCGKCRVTLLEGEVDCPKSLHLSDEDREKGMRLACISRVSGPAVILVPETAGAFKSGIRSADMSSPKEVEIFRHAQSALSEAGIVKDNGFGLVELSLDAPTLSDTMPDNERLSRAIAAKTGESTVRLSSAVVKKAARVLRENDFNIQCVVEKQENCLYVYDIVPAGQTRVYGVAVDIGTTTVSAVMVDLLTGDVLQKTSAGNGQIQFGADVINRIIASCRPGGSERLQKAIVTDTLKPMIGRMCRAQQVNSDAVYQVTVAANTTMNHLFAGLYADPIRMEPYIPTFFEVDGFTGRDFDLGIHPDARVVIAPNVGSYVGGDITAGTLVSMIWNKPEFSLFIDLGTNGELVFGNEDFLMSCACSAGPAFEGGDISCGMRATNGAIEACVIDPDTMEPTLTVIGDTAPIGLCGSGIIDTIAELFRCGIISAKGTFQREGDRVKHDDSGIGRYIMAFADEKNREVSVTEVDIANFIRAKGAIFSAIRTMITSLDMDVSFISNIYVAGGIGSGINIKNAISIGMLPAVPEECYSYVGNTSLAGAYTMLVSDQAKDKVNEIGRNITYLELSAEPGYMDEFVAACFLPHTDSSLFAMEE